MTISTSKLTIGKTSYSLTTLGGARNLDLFCLVPQFAGSAIVALMAGGESDGIDPVLLGRALSEIGDKIARPDFVRLVRGLMESVSLDAVPATGGAPATPAQELSNEAVFNLHFAGNTGGMLRVAIASGRLNFGGFFDAFPELAALAAEAIANAKALRQTSPTGSPGK